MKKIVLYTLDYELFLGSKSGSVKECLIAPTNTVMNLFKQYSVKGIFFIDTIYLMRLKEVSKNYPSAKFDLDQIELQLNQMVKAGHYIFPHIHAHWLDAVYLHELNEWSLTNTRYYRFETVPEQLKNDLFDFSISFLTQFTKDFQKIDGYRAGGWSIQPFSAFQPYFSNYGIQNEFSVLPGWYHFSDTLKFDFRKAPLQITYNFSEDTAEESLNGPFMAYTISSYYLTRIEQQLNRLIHILAFLKRKVIKQKIIGSTVRSKVTDSGYIYNVEGRTSHIAQFEQITFVNLWGMWRLLRTESYIHSVSHPKMMRKIDLFLLKLFLVASNFFYQIETDYRLIAKND